MRRKLHSRFDLRSTTQIYWLNISSTYIHNSLLKLRYFKSWTNPLTLKIYLPITCLSLEKSMGRDQHKRALICTECSSIYQKIKNMLGERNENFAFWRKAKILEYEVRRDFRTKLLQKGLQKSCICFLLKKRIHLNNCFHLQGLCVADLSGEVTCLWSAAICLRLCCNI